MTETIECPFCCEPIEPEASVCPHCSAELTSSSVAPGNGENDEAGGKDAFGPGTVIGSYEIIRALGETSTCGASFLATDRKDSKVVLKCAPLDLIDDPIRREEWISRCRRVASLKHQHLVPVREVLVVDDILVIVRPWIDGVPLGEDVSLQAPLPNIELGRIGLSILAGLESLHTQDPSIVHGNLKPSNILLAKSGHVLLIDSGISYAFDREILQGRTLPSGIYECMSPEQIRGEPAVKASDLYAVGVLLYRLATGAMPFPQSNDSGEACRQGHLSEPPPTVRSVRDDLPEDFEALVRALLAKASEYRMADAGEAAKQLQSALEVVESEASVPASPSAPPPLPHIGADEEAPDESIADEEDEAFGHAADDEEDLVKTRLTPALPVPRAPTSARRNTLIALILLALAGGYLILEYATGTADEKTSASDTEKGVTKKRRPKKKKKNGSGPPKERPQPESIGAKAGPAPPEDAPPKPLKPQPSTCSPACRDLVSEESQRLDAKGPKLVAACDELTTTLDGRLTQTCDCATSPEYASMVAPLRTLTDQRCKMCRDSRQTCDMGLKPLQTLGPPSKPGACEQAKDSLKVAEGACSGVCADNDRLGVARTAVKKLCRQTKTLQINKECAACASDIKKRIYGLRSSVSHNLDNACSEDTRRKNRRTLDRCSKKCSQAEAGDGPGDLRSAKGYRRDWDKLCDEALAAREQRLTRERAAERERKRQAEQERKERERAARAINSL